MTTADKAARRIAAALCLLAIGWALLLPLAPLVHGSQPPRVVSALAWAPYLAGSFVCHQRPDRSFTTRSVVWPVCGRCAGLYLSAALGATLLLASGGAWRAGARGARGLSAWRLVLLLAALPTAVSWCVERAGWWSPASSTRAWLAVPLGVTIGALLALVARGPGQADPGT